MTDPVAQPDDVRREVDTQLDNEVLSDILAVVARDVGREYDVADAFENEDHRRDFEAALTALRIVSGRDRRAEQVSSGRSSVTYEASEVASVRSRVTRRDPGDSFSAGGLRRNTDRHVRATGGDR